MKYEIYNKEKIKADVIEKTIKTRIKNYHIKNNEIKDIYIDYKKVYSMFDRVKHKTNKTNNQNITIYKYNNEKTTLTVIYSYFDFYYNTLKYILYKKHYNDRLTIAIIYQYLKQLQNKKYMQYKNNIITDKNYNEFMKKYNEKQKDLEMIRKTKTIKIDITKIYSIKQTKTKQQKQTKKEIEIFDINKEIETIEKQTITVKPEDINHNYDYSYI